jgi:hypothetical protein
MKQERSGCKICEWRAQSYSSVGWTGRKYNDCDETRRDEPVLLLQLGAQFPCWQAGFRAGSLPICDWRLSQPSYFSYFSYIFLTPSPLRTSFTSQSPSAPYPCSQHINLPSLLLSHFAVISTCHCSLLIILCILHWFLLPASPSSPAPVISHNLYPHPTPSVPSSTSYISFSSPPHFSLYLLLVSSPSLPPAFIFQHFPYYPPTLTSLSSSLPKPSVHSSTSNKSLAAILPVHFSRNGCHIYPPFCVKCVVQQPQLCGMDRLAPLLLLFMLWTLLVSVANINSTAQVVVTWTQIPSGRNRSTNLTSLCDISYFIVSLLFYVHFYYSIKSKLYLWYMYVLST